MILSICISGKNDNKHRNYLWRLSTCINRYTELMNTYGANMEIIYLDWGSECKIKDSIQCDTSKVRWLYVNPDLAKTIQSPFPASIAYNACMRRGRGEYVLQSDSESYMTDISFQRMLGYLELTRELQSQHSQFMEVNRIGLSEAFCSQCPSTEKIKEFLSDKHSLPRQRGSGCGFGGGCAGVLLSLHLFCESTGFDEQHIHWGWSDIEYHKRLTMKFPALHSAFFGFFVYHLDHERQSDIGDHESNHAIEPTLFNANKTFGLEGIDIDEG